MALLMSFPLLSLASASDSTVPRVDWDYVLRQWNQYLTLPTSQNAINLYDSLPSDGHIEYSNSAAESMALDSVYNELGMLERQVISGDTSALRLAFRLFSLADGDFGEQLDIMVGKLIRINPELFLEELNNCRQLIPNLDGLLGNLGEEYVDREEAQELEVTLRVEALRGVTKKSLGSIRNECIANLEDK